MADESAEDGLGGKQVGQLLLPGNFFGSSVENGIFSDEPGYFINEEGQKCQG